MYNSLVILMYYICTEEHESTSFKTSCITFVSLQRRPREGLVIIWNLLLYIKVYWGNIEKVELANIIFVLHEDIGENLLLICNTCITYVFVQRRENFYTVNLLKYIYCFVLYMFLCSIRVDTNPEKCTHNIISSLLKWKNWTKKA